MKKITMLSAGCMLALLLFSTCSKQQDSRVAVRLKDAPAAFDKLEIQVKSIQLHNDRGEWVTVPMDTRIINILELKDTSMLLGVTSMPIGKITEVKLVLGRTNTITIGGQTISLVIREQDKANLIVKVNERVTGTGTLVILVDLDGAQSIIQGEEGGFFLNAHIVCTSHHNYDNYSE
jgi:hypothetical protein